MSKDFLFNPNNPKKSFDVYIDKNPKDTFAIKYKTLEEQLDEAYCCVVFGNSTAGVHSLLRGVPIIALSEGKLYKSVTNTIENIENLDYEVDLTNWKNGLGYSMWQVSDFESGEAWNYILK